jgi:hypothetical protein
MKMKSLCNEDGHCDDLYIIQKGLETCHRFHGRHNISVTAI